MTVLEMNPQVLVMMENQVIMALEGAMTVQVTQVLTMVMAAPVMGLMAQAVRAVLVVMQTMAKQTAHSLRLVHQQARSSSWIYRG